MHSFRVRVSCLGFQGFRVLGLGFRGLGLRGLGLRGLGFRVLGFLLGVTQNPETPYLIYSIGAAQLS